MKISSLKKLRDNPEEIADLIERMDMEHQAKFEKFYGRSPSSLKRDVWREKLPLSDGREEFIATWVGMRVPPWTDPLLLAFGDARDAHKPLLLPRKMRSFNYRMVLSIAYYLQKRFPHLDVLLPQERIAKELEVSQRCVSSYITQAVSNGFLHITANHNVAAKRAKAYRFALSRFDPFTGEEVEWK
jgi:hypothetical protein